MIASPQTQTYIIKTPADKINGSLDFFSINKSYLISSLVTESPRLTMYMPCRGFSTLTPNIS